jgi:hypothetical protein
VLFLQTMQYYTSASLRQLQNLRILSKEYVARRRGAAEPFAGSCSISGSVSIDQRGASSSIQ